MDAATKNSKSKDAPTSSKKPRPQKKGKTVKATKPKTELARKEPMVVFALRLTKAQRDQIHKAAGPGKATRFVRSVAIAAANADRKTFDMLAEQARANLK